MGKENFGADHRSNKCKDEEGIWKIVFISCSQEKAAREHENQSQK